MSRIACATFLVGLTLLASQASAQILITEAMSSSGQTIGNGGDWFEITNTGAGLVSLAGWRVDDSSASVATSFPLFSQTSGSLSISPGESIVFIELTSTQVSSQAGIDAQILAFRNLWGGLAGIQVGYYQGANLGLSSAGDGVAVFDGAASIADQVSFGAATAGVSFIRNPNTLAFGALAANGVFGAYTVTGPPANTGSPGIFVPEPSSIVMAGMGLAALLVGYRRRRTVRLA